jgi:alpha-beta hydrolase superfamily lysophospholipase
MALFSSATIRFDFPAHGESPMEDADFSLQNCVQTLLAVAQYAKGRFPEVEDLCIFATGFGAYVTLIASEVLEALPGRIRLVVQTPSVLMHETLLAMLRTTREEFQERQRIQVKTERPFWVSYRLYEELRSNIALTPHSLPMLILHGESDDFIRVSDIQQFHRINERAKLVIIPGTSHRFLEEGAWDMVLDLTRDWFEFEQVLLSEWS